MIEVGEYVKIVLPKHTIISQIYKIEDSKIEIIGKKYYCMVAGTEHWFTLKDIQKHSFNKEDLL